MSLTSVRTSIKWEDKLLDSEKMTKDGKSLVFLRGLQRLAHEAGLHKSSCHHTHIPVGECGIFQCVYTVEFLDGSIFVGSADCNSNNTDDTFFDYPTAVAESRAESRALRKALNIQCLAAEEIGFNSDNIINDVSKLTTNKADQQVIRAIESALKKKNLEGQTLAIVTATLSDDRSKSFSGLQDLTPQEAQSVLRAVNMFQANNEEPTTDRASRKEALKKKLNGE